MPTCEAPDCSSSQVLCVNASSLDKDPGSPTDAAGSISIPILSSPTLPVLKVLYIFSGKKRRSDLSDQLSYLANACKFILCMKEFDLEKGDDILDKDSFDDLLLSLQKEQWHVCLVTPPCNSVSRARHSWKTSPGPRPVRSAKYPMGFPWLTGKNLKLVMTHNEIFSRSFQILVAASKAGTDTFLEHPENLGLASDGEVPASIFNFPEYVQWASSVQHTSFAIFQCMFGASSSKPTRLTTTLKQAMLPSSLIFRGEAVLDREGKYKGPLPKCCMHGSHPPLLGHDGHSFRTSPAASYPPAMCAWIAELIVQSHAPFDQLFRQLNHTTSPSVGESAEAALSGALQSVKTLGLMQSELGQCPVGEEPLHEPSQFSHRQCLKGLPDARANIAPGACDSLGQRVSELGQCPVGEVPLHEPSQLSRRKDAGVINVQKARNEKSTNDEPEENSRVWKQYLGFQEPRWTDGFGLCSTTRLLPNQRMRCLSSEAQRFCRDLSKIIDDSILRSMGGEDKCGKIVVTLALGKLGKGQVPEVFSPKILDAVRSQWLELLVKHSGLKQDYLERVPEGQPFYLPAISASLKILNDPDWQAIDTLFAEGVPVGFREELPRVPAVFMKKEKWRSYDESTFKADCGNYTSFEQASESVRDQFLEEEKLGMMQRIGLQEAKDLYGERLRIAAQGAIDKGDGSFRIIHDGTHGVQINNEIVVQDQITYSGPEDSESIMRHAWPSTILFALGADISKAHRRVKHKKEDWGLLACRDGSVEEGAAQEVWINKVGTFGIGSIAYWWMRLMSALGRFVNKLALDEEFYALLFADDLKLLAAGESRYRVLLRILVAWIMIGTPFSLHKFRGGLQIDWVGYWCDYGRFMMGVSEKRGRWLVRWARDLVANERAHMKSFAEGLGRLGFASLILKWLKPVLSPLYAWSATVPDSAVLLIPTLVKTVLSFLADQLELAHKVPVKKRRARGHFKTDASCQMGKVVLGGFDASVPTAEARWFSITILPEQASWLFREGDSKWASTSAEMLASTAAMILLVEDGESDWFEAVVTGTTDNQASSLINKKGSSTKVPLMFVVMQMAEVSWKKKIRAELSWTPRENNTDADDLTNGKFDNFDSAKRICCSFEDLKLSLLDRLILESDQFVEARDANRELGATNTLGRGTKRKSFDKTPWQ